MLKRLLRWFSRETRFERKLRIRRELCPTRTEFSRYYGMFVGPHGSGCYCEEDDTRA